MTPSESAAIDPADIDAIRALFALDPAISHLNHGSFGAVPHAVERAAAAWRARADANPNRFFRDDIGPALASARALAAARLGGRTDDWAFVENATQGINAAVASLDLQPGDVVATTSQAYGAVLKCLRHHTARTGAALVVVPLPMPAEGPEAIAAAWAAAMTRPVRLAVLDQIVSQTALVLPLGQMIPAARAAGALVLVDGAHGPGQIALDVPRIGADWYVGNAHKWLFAARGTALLWAAPGRQEGLHPTSISHGLGQGYVAEFAWTGTRDFAAWAALDAAIAFHDRLGGDKLIARNRAQAAGAAARLTAAWREVAAAPASMSAAMATIRLPAALQGGTETAEALRRHLSAIHRIEVPLWAEGGRLWLRVSAQAYNRDEEYDALAEAVLAIAAKGGFE
jgi:isopenicillin-N epimerase